MGILDNILCGLLAGLIATVPMTFIVFLVFHYLPKYERFAIPNFHIARVFTRRIGTQYIDPTKHRVLTFVNHFGFGAIAGAFFAALEGHINDFFIVKGLLFGLFVWAFSYFFLLPNMGLFPLPERRPSCFNLIMASSHLVWGLFLVLCYLFFYRGVPFRQSLKQIECLFNAF